MNNITFSSKFSPQHDNGERALCWKKGVPERKDSLEYLCTSISGKVFHIQVRSKESCLDDDNLRFWNCLESTWISEEDVIAYTKLPTPYKPD